MACLLSTGPMVYYHLAGSVQEPPLSIGYVSTLDV
jgi:hypothetical protein